jgi:hypothetical protein
MALPNQTYVDPLLTDVSIRYTNESFIATDVFPDLPVAKDVDKVFKFDKTNLRKPSTTAREGFARAVRIDYGLSQVTTPPLVEASLEIGITNAVMDNYDAPLVPMVAATNTVTEQILVEKEYLLSQFLQNTSNLTQNTTLSGAAQWSAYTTSNPFGDLQLARTTIKQNSGKNPNVLVLGRQVWYQLVNHPNVTDRIKYTARADQQTIANALGDLFGFQTVIIGESIYNSAQPGLADSLGFIWGKFAVAAYIAPLPALETVSLGYHLYRPNERYVDTWYEQEIKTTIVRCNDYYTRFLMATEAGYLILGAVA